jgi:hypothetical protein
MPLNRPSFERLQPAFLAGYLAYVTDLARAYPGVRFAAEPSALGRPPKTPPAIRPHLRPWYARPRSPSVPVGGSR